MFKKISAQVKNKIAKIVKEEIERYEQVKFREKENMQKTEKMLIADAIVFVNEKIKILNSMMDYIKDYGNPTKRKNNKLKIDDYNNMRRNILSLAYSSGIATVMILNDSELKVKFKRLESEIQQELFMQNKREKK